MVIPVPQKARGVSLIVVLLNVRLPCGITDKPREVIEDIDKLDVNDQLAVVEYIEDIYTFYKTAEVTAEISAM